ncbi:MAG: glycerol-3-phosphate acyltransferase [Anaerolineae bacterium]|jgi:acyl phosphate:glycerol-3-phosphate acyltransferase|nr:glycerol-3-phosphate acyltransferase [Anaerolineae bacterium]MBT7783507.1 glycerol-3-phosphate acyltransferase [Anaerolineae bacterium]
MQIFQSILIIIIGYLIGSVPIGLLIVKMRTGKDVRQVESGRTGGTNVMRAAGFWSGFVTGILDIVKAACTVWLARAFGAGVWAEVLVPIAAIIGHNYSVFLVSKKDGKTHFGGGAGGAASVGGALGLWAPSILLVFPIGLFIFFAVGYASVATMSVALIATVIFIVRAWMGLSPWQYILYGVLAEALLIWALRPNIKRLLAGEERLHGWRSKEKTWGVGEEKKE